MSDQVSGHGHAAPEPSEIEALLDTLSRVLDEAGLDPPLRYAVAVMLLAREVRGTSDVPFPDRLQHLMHEALQELQRLKAATPAPRLLR